MRLPLQKIKPHHLTFTLFGVLILTVISYIYLLSLSVVHVVMQEQVKLESQNRLSRIAELESAYIEAHHQVNTQLAQIDGFTAVKDKIFIARTPQESIVLRTTQN